MDCSVEQRISPRCPKKQVTYRMLPEPQCRGLITPVFGIGFRSRLTKTLQDQALPSHVNGKRGREDSNGDNDTEDVADADYFADDADDVSGRSSLDQ